MIPLKQSTASQEIPLGFFVDATDGDTAETGLTIANTDIKLWKAGATTLASKNSGGGTHISGGVYYCVLDATDTDTLGPLVIFVHVAGARPVVVYCVVGGYATAFDANLAAMGGSAQSATDLKDFADTGYDPSTHNVAEVDSVAALGTQAKADVNAEVVDVMATDTYAEPGQGTPAATASLAAKINYLYKAWRNKKTQTSTTWSLFNDDAATVDQKATISDDTVTATKGEIATGP